MRTSSFAACATSLGCSLVQQATSVLARAAVLGAYAWVHAFAWFEIEMTLPAWLVLAVLVDHQYYWWHRASHRVGIFWASHAVHHQSEEYDLATALRQSALQGALASPIYWPLAILGFPPLAFFAASMAVGLYQFWLHTRLIGRLPPPLEQLFNTPSHHRVHHGIDAKYVDKNYGGVLVLWDRLYGTFRAEEEEPRYGTVRPFESSSPAWANAVEWSRMLDVARRTSRLSDKLRVLVAPPEWSPPDVVPLVACRPRERVERHAPRWVVALVALQLALIATAMTIALLIPEPIEGAALALAITWISLVTVSWGGLFEQRAWARPLALALALSIPLAILVGCVAGP